MAEMTVELVAVERKIWSGPANFLLARTAVGEIGVLPGHEPTLAQLENTAVVRVDGTDGTSTTLAVHGGFLSQNLLVAEQFTGQPGSTVPLKETIEAFDKIAKGDFDDVPEQAFFLCGGLDDLDKNRKKLQG